MTQAPDREGRRPAPAQPAAPEGVDKTAWSKGVVVANAALIVVVAIVGIRYTQSQRDEQSDETAAAPRTSTAPAASAVPTAAASAAPVVAAPAVAATFRADFAKGDSWPQGADPRDVGSMAWDVGVVDGVMTHGAPSGTSAASWMQKWTQSDVRRIGGTVRFAPNHSGEAALTAWYSSVLDEDGDSLPRTGLRLIASPRAWRLVALAGNGEQVLGQGTYRSAGGTASFNVVRKGSTAWVTDPAGTVTRVQDPAIARLSGPWATWELREDRAGERPAAFTAVWAG